MTREERLGFVKKIIESFVPEIARHQPLAQQAITDQAQKIVDRWEADLREVALKQIRDGSVERYNRTK